MARGGKRLGAGRKPGTNGLEKEQARALLRKMVFEHMQPMIEAQIKNAQGLRYLVAREKKTGKFKKLTESEAIIALGQESESEFIEVWEERPNVQAFTDLMNRTLDKPSETIQATVSIQGLGERIRLARQRSGS